jgi:arginine/glutamate-rich protein 1
VTGGRITAAQAAQLAALEEEVVRNVEEAVASKVDEAMQSEEVQARIQVCGCFHEVLIKFVLDSWTEFDSLNLKARLIEERAKLEEKVTAQLEAEKSALLEKKRREQDEARRRQDELERILAENRRKVSSGVRP